MLAYLSALRGNTRKAEDYINSVESFAKDRAPIKTNLARIYIALGKVDEGLTLLENAIEDRSSDLLAVAVDPRLGAVRSHPRLGSIIKRIGIV